MLQLSIVSIHLDYKPQHTCVIMVEKDFLNFQYYFTNYAN